VVSLSSFFPCLNLNHDHRINNLTIKSFVVVVVVVFVVVVVVVSPNRLKSTQYQRVGRLSTYVGMAPACNRCNT